MGHEQVRVEVERSPQSVASVVHILRLTETERLRRRVQDFSLTGFFMCPPQPLRDSTGTSYRRRIGDGIMMLLSGILLAGRRLTAYCNDPQ